MAERHVPDDEHTPHQPCASTAEHPDHFWRTDGKADRYAYTDSPHTRYCYGVPSRQPGSNYPQ